MVTHLNIVVVEDNDDLRDAIVDVMGSMGHRVLGVSCAEALNDENAQAMIDLLVVDLNLPGEDGVSLARRLRNAQPGLRVLMMTARGSVRDKVEGYDAGADIYLTKPVSIEELTAAVKSLERRLRAPLQQSDDAMALLVSVAELNAKGPRGSIELSAVEAAMLSALARAPGHRLAYWQLLEIMTPRDASISQANLAVRLTRLRKKLAAIGFERTTLQVVRQEGCYQLCVPVRIL